MASRSARGIAAQQSSKLFLHHHHYHHDGRLLRSAASFSPVSSFFFDTASTLFQPCTTILPLPSSTRHVRSCSTAALTATTATTTWTRTCPTRPSLQQPRWQQTSRSRIRAYATTRTTTKVMSGVYGQPVLWRSPTYSLAQQLCQRSFTSSRPAEVGEKEKEKKGEGEERPLASPQASPSTTPATPSRVLTPNILQKALASTATPHENIYTLPNILTFSRLLSAPLIGYFILQSEPLWALGLFAYAGLTDLVDGFLARRYHSQTVLGTILDPMADKTLMTVAVVSLAVQAHLPVWLAVIILGRDVGLAMSACYYRYISLPPPKTFVRYWDFSLPSAEVRPTEISKINTLLQLLLVADAMVLPVLPTTLVEAYNLTGVFEGWSILVAATTVWSGLSYVFAKDAVKILGGGGSSGSSSRRLPDEKEKNKT